MMKNKRFKYIAGFAAVFLMICMFRSCCDALFAASREVYPLPFEDYLPQRAVVPPEKLPARFVCLAGSAFRQLVGLK